MKKETVYESEEYKIAMLIRHVDLSITKARRNEMEFLGVTPPQMGILHFAMKFQPKCTVLTLRQHMLRSNNSLVAILNRMEKKELIERKPDPRNKKFTRITVTAKGEALYRQAMNLSSFSTIISSLPQQDREKLKEYLYVLGKSAMNVLVEQRDSHKAKDLDIGINFP